MHPAGRRQPEGSGTASGRSARILPGPTPTTPTEPAPPPARGRRGWFWGLAFGLAYVAFRTSPVMLTGYEADVHAYISWFRVIANSGLRTVYERSYFDYPPLYAYMLWALAKGQALLATLGLGRGFGTLDASGSPSTSLLLMMRFWPFVSDLAVGWMLSRVGRAAERSAAERSAAVTAGGERGPAWGWILPLLYLLNPAVLFNGGYWGQTDSIHSAFVLAAFLALGWKAAGFPVPLVGRGIPAWVGWMLLSLGGLMKPVALPYFPLLLGLSVVWHGVRATLIGMAASVITVAAACAPFMVGGNTQSFIEELVNDVGSMPFTTCNAHNLWWILAPWRPANEPWLGSVSATDVGHVLFGICLLAILVRTWQIALRREVSQAEGLGLAAALGVGFFLLSTHMHENHLYTPIPLLIPVVVLPWALGPARTRAALWVVGMLTLGAFINMVAHDPWLMTRGPWAEHPGSVVDPATILPTGARRKVLATLGTAINFGAGFLLFRMVFQGSTLAPLGRRVEPECPS